MKCYNCDVEINSKFKFAFKLNKCPACDHAIMPVEKLASYMGLQQLLKNNFPNIETEKITNLVLANFEIKQLFKEEGVQPDSNSESVVTEVVEEEIDEDAANAAYDKAHKEKQAEEAKTLLKKEREEIYEDSLLSQVGLGSDEDDMFSEVPDEEIDPIKTALKMGSDANKIEKYENMLSGAGSFTRSS